MTLDLRERRSELLALRARLVAAVASVEHDRTADEETGELPTFGSDEIADHASDTLERELDGTLEVNAGQVLREVDDALARLEEGKYGVCVVCGNEIPEERLEAIPYATLCIEDRRQQERR